MIKWEHSIFALPFALCGAMLAAGGLPSVHQLVWIVVAMVAARSAAMAFNRWADAAIDAANPRTSTRALPAGHLSPAFVATFVVVSSVVFILAASQLNRLSLELSPVALAVLLLYSYTKRLTRWSHLVLGFALGNRAICRMDCSARLARSTNSSAHRGGHVLGRWFRRFVCLPGLRVRSPVRIAFRAAILRHRRRALDCAGLSPDHGGPARRISHCVWNGKAGDLRRLRGGAPAALRALAGEAHATCRS